METENQRLLFWPSKTIEFTAQSKRQRAIWSSLVHRTAGAMARRLGRQLPVLSSFSVEVEAMTSLTLSKEARSI
jgi:hypothetical protein